MMQLALGKIKHMEKVAKCASDLAKHTLALNSHVNRDKMQEATDKIQKAIDNNEEPTNQLPFFWNKLATWAIQTQLPSGVANY